MIDVAVVALYFLVMLSVGWFSRHHSAESYWVADRRYGTGRITLSLVATIFGASSTMGVIGLGYTRGLTGAWWSLIGGLALIPFALFLASRVRALNVFTLPDILKGAYGDRVAVPAGLMIAVAWCGVVAAQMIAAAHLTSGLFGVDFDTALLLVSIVFILYTLWGGQLSVIRTDAWQLLLFLAGLLVSLALLLSSQSQVQGFWENVPAAHWHFPTSETFGWYQAFVFYPLIVGLPYLVGPDIYSRVLCAKDIRAARRSALAAASITIPLSFLLAFTGLLARARFPEIAPDAALPTVLNVLVPMGLKGLITAGFLGAIMSSADTCLISAATILTLNVVRPVTGVKERHHLTITKWTVVAVGVVSWFVASRQQGIISSLLMGYTVFVGGVVCPTLATFFVKRFRVPSTAALWSIIVGGGTAILGRLQGGELLRALLTSDGDALMRGLLGPRYASILPICLSALILLASTRKRGADFEP